jgi:anti-anti-sigma factor
MADLRLLSSRHDLVVRSRDEHGVRVITVAGEADLQTEHRLSRGMREVLPRAGTPLVIDLATLTFCSAYAMGVLVDMVGSTVHRGVTVGVVGLPPITARVWLLTDVPIPVQYSSVEVAVAALTRPSRRSTDVPADPDSGTARLHAELEGLRRALATRATIEQAKGMLMERLTCTSDEAFNLIVLQSQRSARKLHDIAADYLHSGAETISIQGPTTLEGFTPRGGPQSGRPHPDSAA